MRADAPFEPLVDDLLGHARALVVELLPAEDQVVPVGGVVLQLPPTSCDRTALPALR